MTRWRSRLATFEVIVIVGLMLLQLAACSSSAQVAPADRDAALAFIRGDQSPLSVQLVAMWYANADPGSMVCGEIEAPAALKSRHSTLRYVYDRRWFGG